MAICKRCEVFTVYGGKDYCWVCTDIRGAVEEMRERAALEAEGQVWDDAEGFIQDQIAASIRRLEIK